MRRKQSHEVVKVARNVCLRISHLSVCSTMSVLRPRSSEVGHTTDRPQQRPTRMYFTISPFVGGRTCWPRVAFAWCLHYHLESRVRKTTGCSKCLRWVPCKKTWSCWTQTHLRDVAGVATWEAPSLAGGGLELRHRSHMFNAEASAVNIRISMSNDVPTAFVPAFSFGRAPSVTTLKQIIMQSQERKPKASPGLRGQVTIGPGGVAVVPCSATETEKKKRAHSIV